MLVKYGKKGTLIRSECGYGFGDNPFIQGSLLLFRYKWLNKAIC